MFRTSAGIVVTFPYRFTPTALNDRRSISNHYSCKYQPICYCIIFVFIIFFERLVQRISKTAIDSCKLPTDPQSGGRRTIQFYPFPQYFLLFHLFRWSGKNFNQFSRKQFNQLENCFRINGAGMRFAIKQC